jgi:hypothetical protein
MNVLEEAMLAKLGWHREFIAPTVYTVGAFYILTVNKASS